MVKVSVLMPVYNTKEEYLREAMESILGQTYSDFELLIVDDCPANYVEEIVKSYKDKRIKYVKNDVNLGISKSRNKLMDLAKGKYLAVMDHDDISMPTRFEKQVEFLDENEDVGVLGSYTMSFPNNKSVNLPIDDESIQSNMLVSCGLSHPSVMLRKSIIDKFNIRYKNEFSPAEDYAMWCELLGKTKFANLDEILLKYRVHSTNTSKIQNEKMRDSIELSKSIARAKNPDLWEIAKASGAIQVSRVSFLGIPLFTVKKNYKKTKIYLLEYLPIISLKSKYKYSKKKKYGL